ncbi:hypothetical protein LDO26_16170 [Luteimonas sp. BDR2-5]|uniref:acetyl-CoA hydrolase/transferase family protein n=1 Tax=Proluteimonas luteida TaxID=2878685 RepID=UPI001E6060F7|nr:acetyl-CoA hydrolase/transferase C-terminal domain-containing protein [Luteimonas sp. BDR2-5]MCD9029730.1 hypothetical protein [Luteimonas sp. BDR2-5]
MKSLQSLDWLSDALAPGQGIVLHSGAAHPARLARMLAESAAALRGRRLHTLMPCGDLPYADPGVREQFAITAFLPGSALRPAMDSGHVEALRVPLSQIPSAFDKGEFPVGAVLLRVSPPDPDGWVSLGVSVDYMPAAINAARWVIAEIDPHMPRTCGDSRIRVERIDAYVDSTDLPFEALATESDPIEIAIAEHIATLVSDGDVLQLGVGSLPDRVLARLDHLKHLGVHTGIIGNGAMPLIERGVIDNSRKAVFAGTSVATMALGSLNFYGFIDQNPAISLHPCSVTHDAGILRRLGSLCAINSALQVDLNGAVNAEWAGRRRISLPGGLADFARAAAAQTRGSSIIALRAVNRFGESTIVPRLDAAAEPSLVPPEVDHVVTEFGIASLRGRSPSQRRQALLAIASPLHRDMLAGA